MKATISEQPARLLAGFSFFGDPFRSHGGWSAENEIGRLWQRWGEYWQAYGATLLPATEPGVMYEFHVYSPETLQTGEFEVFTGVEIAYTDGLPLEVVAKLLPAARYAIFTLSGEEIISDWEWQVDNVWLPELGAHRRMTFSFQRYDARFKGMDRIAESELDVYIPLLT